MVMEYDLGIRLDRIEAKIDLLLQKLMPELYKEEKKV